METSASTSAFSPSPYQSMSVFRRTFRFAEVVGDPSPYINEDIKPLPPSRRTWTKTTFFWFWLATTINVSDLAGSSTLLSLGLNVWQSILATVIADLIITAALVANGMQGGTWHIPFAVGNRAPWGVRGAWFVVANRLILSFVWYGYQGWFGGQLVKNLIATFWPGFYTMKNHFPASANMKTNDFICYVIFWCLAFPLLFVRPERYRIPAVVSSFCVSIATIALLAYVVAKQGNAGPLIYDTSKLLKIKPLTSVQLGWAMTRGITAKIGAWSGAIIYAADFSRYARKPGDQIWGQAFIVPASLIGTSVIGLIITSCGAGLYPESGLLWQPYKMIQAIQQHNPTSGCRAALFFLSLSFICSQLCINVVTCGVVGGIDLATMFPRYIDVKRGSAVVAVVGFAINPWQLVNTATTFLSVLSGYSIFLGPLAGIMFADYFVLRRQKVRLSHLYTPNYSSDYWFFHGVNLKAPFVWACSIGPSLPGFISTVTKGKVVVSLKLVRLSYLAWPLGFAIATFLWLVLNKIDRPPGVGQVDDADVFGTFDELTDSVGSNSELAVPTFGNETSKKLADEEEPKL
ncbi:Uridine permease/thiamine transporter/allantoin transport [Phaffia rhodozyma]|uniref:Uridine permease/thiamine transporter/allantoin transport n=1 Tax=Phaffia rhodozyma TaxID=264483 RepID=A0A0F7STH0_PHARH|nr:Uridine permease/thiamine transporter/allantoin transport [Phaffia rhodozyma]